MLSTRRLMQFIFLFTVVSAVDIRLPPAIVEGPQLTRSIYRQGDKKTLKCRATGVPRPEYTWWHNGVRLDLNEEYIRPLTDGDIEITLESSLAEGIYQCEANNQYGSAISRTVTLRQAKQPSRSSSLQVIERVVSEGQPFRIERDRAPWYPPPLYEWKTGRIQDEQQTDYVLSHRVQIDTDTGDLHFAYARLSDELADDKVYKCVVFNPHLDLRAGGSYTSVTVRPTVGGHVRPFGPRIAFTTSSPHVALQGHNTSLHCFFYGNPAPRLSWSKRDGSLPSHGRYQLPSSSHNSQLDVNNLQQSDEGDYVCTANNDRGSQSTVIRLDVQAVPEFRDKYNLPRNMNATDGESVTVRCDAYAEPPANITWMQNGHPLDPDKLPWKFHLSRDRRQLTIRDLCKNCGLDRSDLQVIQCNASNVHGYDFAQGYINVLERTRLVDGSDVEQTVSHSEEAELSFKCSARSDDSTPTNTTWYRLETDRSTGRTYEQTVYNQSDKLSITGPHNTLTIKLPANDSEGWAVYGGRYLCRATNGYSSDHRLIIIDVLNIPVSEALHESSILDLWWILVILAVLLLLLIVLLCCIFCFQRNRGDTYPVDAKERENGNNPEKEMYDNEFQTYSRPNDGPVKPAGSMAGSVHSLVSVDDDTASMDGYGDVDVGKYNEDGSFVGVYTTDQPSRQRGRVANRSNV